MEKIQERLNPNVGCDQTFENYSFWEFSKDDWVMKSDVEIAAKISVLCFICLTGVVVNLSVIIVIIKHKLLRQNSANLFLLSMCFSDLLNLSTSPFLYIYKQPVLFRFYLLSEIPCKLTPFTNQVFMLAGAMSLTIITLNRVSGILVKKPILDLKNEKYVRFIIIAIWLTAIAVSSPTIMYRRFWCRKWSDLVEYNCDDSLSDTLPYWFTSLTLCIWIPSLIMFMSYFLISRKLKNSNKWLFTLSGNIRHQRSNQNRKIIRMLYMLLVVQNICWIPWQSFTILDAITRGKDQSPFMKKFLPILHDIKFYVIFFNGALNPFLYGYCNLNMRKAFRLTFTCFFKGKPNYYIQRGFQGQNTFTFNRILCPHRRGIAESLVRTGQTAIAPIDVVSASSIPEKPPKTSLKERLISLVSEKNKKRQTNGNVVRGVCKKKKDESSTPNGGCFELLGRELCSSKSQSRQHPDDNILYSTHL